MTSQGGAALPIYIQGCETSGRGVQAGTALPVYVVGSDLSGNLNILDDVSISSPLENQVLQYNPAGYWENRTVVTLGGTTNAVRIDTGGELELLGTATRWDDLRIEPVARNTGTNAPSFEQWADDNGLGDTGTSRGVYLYSFDDALAASEKEIFFSMQMPHSWKGTSIYLHVHWIGNLADTTAAPRWGCEYNWKDIGRVFGATNTIYTDGSNYTEIGTDADIVAGKHYISKFTTLVPGASAVDMSSVLIGRIFRNSSNGADTYNVASNKCGLLYIDAHYEIDTMGSRSEYVK